MSGNKYRYFDPKYWNLNPIPPYLNFWPLKANHIGRRGLFSSKQPLPSGVTLRLLTAGTWSLTFGGKFVPLSAGDIFLCVPSVPVEFSQTDPKASWEWYEIQFGGPGATAAAKRFGVSLGTPVAKPADFKKALRLFKAMHSLMADKARRTEDELLSILFQAAQACRKDKDSHPQVVRINIKRSSKLEKAIEVFESLPYSDRNVCEVADELGMDRSMLYRLFKGETGISPHKYIDGLRLSRAKDLLGASGLTVSAVAIQLGFVDSKYFIRWFKSRTNYSPGAWRHTAYSIKEPSPKP